MTIQTELSSPTEKKTPIIYKVLAIFVLLGVIVGSLTGVMTYTNAGYNATFF
ncbi:hypothetical protein JCM30760_20070 [Thiomicrorhabdus hydrogeniphila]